MTGPSRRTAASRWLVSAALLAVGVALLVAEAADGEVADGLGSLAVLGGAAVLLAFGGRFEAVRLARGEGGHERDELIGRRAMAAAGTVLVVALTCGLAVALVRGGDPTPYAWVLAAGGLTHAVALIVGRARS